MAAAEASGAAAQPSGLATGVVTGLVILGLGLVGLSGAFVTTVARRRKASSAGGRSTES